MSSVDSRIVTMKFDNTTFERDAAVSLGTLAKLKQSLNFGNVTGTATKAFSGLHGMLSKFGLTNPFAKTTEGVAELNKATNQFGTTGISTIQGGITSVSHGFIAMSTIAITALANITTAAMQTGTQMVKSLTIDPVLGGLREYETNLNSIQTILANTGLEGQKGLDLVNGALQELNHYSDKTIYNFSEMARNIGTFTAAGVDLDTSTAAIKGIANLAAVSGSNSVQASTAMYQLSQALAAGRVSLMDWNSVVNAGMGGKVFQESLKETARVHGIAVDSIIKEQGSFRNSLQEGWITSEVLTETLSKFTGDLNAAQLKSMGYNEEQIKGILKMGKTATDAATKVKTASQLVDTLKETVGSGWAKTWQLVLGDFGEAKKLWTGVNNALGSILGQSAKTRNKLISDWKDLGGRTVLIEAISNAWEALLDIIKPIRKAFRDIFPKQTGQTLYEMTTALRDFTEGLSISDETAENLRRTFRGVFAIFSIIGQIIGGVIGMFGRLFDAMGDGSGGFLEFTGGIGDTLVAFDQFLEQSGSVENFFSNLGDILAVPLQFLVAFAKAVGTLFTGFDSASIDDVGNAVDELGNRLSPLQVLAGKIHNAFVAVFDVLGNIGSILGDALGNIGDAIAGAITPETFAGTLDVIDTALIGGMLLLLKDFFDNGLVDLDFGQGGLIDSIKETLGGVTDTLTSMQQQVKADILMKIAIALALLTASISVLALIDGKELAKALTGMAIGMGAMTAALLIMSKYISYLGLLKLPFITAALIGVAGAMILMAVALRILAGIEFADMLRGLAGLGGMLFILQKALTPLSANAAGTLRAAGSLLILSVALNAMAIALKIFASMSWEEMARGLVGVAGALGIIVIAMQLMPMNMVLQAAALVLLAGALNGIGVALKIFGSMSWEEIAKGLVNLAGALLIIAAAVYLIPVSIVLIGPALIAVGIALNIIAGALKIMGSMGWEEIARGLVALGGAMLILAVGLNLMSGAVGGAAALMVAAAALAVLTPVLVVLGGMSWESIAKGLAAIAGVFVVLGLAGFILAPVVPVIIALAAALVLIGAGLALAGIGAVAFATAFTMLVATGAGAAQVVVDLMSGLADTIPLVMQAVGEGLILLAEALSKGGPEITDAFITILDSLIEAGIRNIPKFGRLMVALITTMLKVITTAYPRIADAGLRLIGSLLEAVANNVPRIATQATRVITEFLRALGKNLPKIADAGAKMVIKLINGIADAIDENSKELGEAAANLAWALVEGVVQGLYAYGGRIGEVLLGIGKNALEGVKNFFGVHSPSTKTRDELGKPMAQGVAAGLDAMVPLVNKSALNVGEGALETIKMSMKRMPKDLGSDISMNPTITPVLDLTQLSRDASRIGGMMGHHKINADVSYSRAAVLSSDDQERREYRETSSDDDGPRELKIEQNNFSPKAIDEKTQYRYTKSAFALAKEAL